MKNFTKLLFLLITVSTFSQSPWTQEKGKFYTQLSFTTIPNYDTLFGEENLTTNRNITDNTIQFYGEYGLTDKATLLINLPLKLLKFEGNNASMIRVGNNVFEPGDKNSLGNIEIGIKHNFYKKDWLISGQLSVEANTNSFDVTTGIRTGYDAWSFKPILIAGKSFGKTFIQTFIGGDIKTNNYSSNFKIGGEIGRKLGKHLWLIGFLDISKSLKNGNISLPLSNLATGLYINDQEYGSFGFKGIREFTDNFGITAGFGGAFFGNNVAKQAALTFGVYHKI